ncbi:unnamed protein product [Closterium sp. NIES-64]|nr:unnamed protein product [Closterium sp. NIES-64]
MANPYQRLLTELPNPDGGSFGSYYSLPALNDPRIDELPISIRYLLESAIRNCDNFQVMEKDIEKILDWANTSQHQVEIPFKPARVILQDFTGVPAVVDLAAMRDAMKESGGDPNAINPQVPVDLVIDHSVQVDYAGASNALSLNMEREFERNRERFAFLKWGSKAFSNMLVVPPGAGIVHQVNLEYLARVVMDINGLLYPDSVVGTDSHTTMIDGLGVAGWGVGGIEAEAAMLGQAMSMVLPQVVGFKLTGKLQPGVTATDLVLTCTQMLRKHGVVGKFVEFYGEGTRELSLADRATVANMSPEYGATMGFFPVDSVTLQYLRVTGRDETKLKQIETYMRANNLFMDHTTAGEAEAKRKYSSYLELDLATVEPCVSGPKRPHDRVTLKTMKSDWHACLDNPVGFKGFAIPKAQQDKAVKVTLKEGVESELKHGSVVIAAITSCTNTSNPSVMLAAAIVAKKASERGLQVKPYVKTSLAPGSNVVTKYLEASGLLPALEGQGFHVVGYGCTTCIGNSGEIHEAVGQAIADNDLVAAAVLSGNRNFEGRVHPLTRANYLASPPLVVAYALAGTVDIDFETEPIGTDKDGKEVFLRDIWPSKEEVAEVVERAVLPQFFQTSPRDPPGGKDVKDAFCLLNVGDSITTDHISPAGGCLEECMCLRVWYTCVYSEGWRCGLWGGKDVKDAFCLLNVGDSITTDHISPAGSIHKDSAAAKYLTERGVARKDFNSYGSRRGNGELAFAAAKYLTERGVARKDFNLYDSRRGQRRGSIHKDSAAAKYLTEWGVARKDFNSYGSRWGNDEVMTRVCTSSCASLWSPPPCAAPGSIHKDSPAARYLTERGVPRKDFNSYGSRRGNDEVMTRGTFANIRLVNKLAGGEVGPKTVHLPSGEKMSVFDAAMRYKAEGHPTIVLAGAEYGSGSSRDWAAKGPYLQGVRAVISVSFERIHRSNLVGMGIIPLCFKPGQNAETLGLTGKERFSFSLPPVDQIQPGQDVVVSTDNGNSFTCTLRFDTELEKAYYNHGGILHFVLRQLLAKSTAA